MEDGITNDDMRKRSIQKTHAELIRVKDVLLGMVISYGRILNTNARILNAHSHSHSHSMSGSSIWASLECHWCFWLAGGLVSYLTMWLLALQLFKNSIDTREKLMKIHELPLIECECAFRIQLWKRYLTWTSNRKRKRGRPQCRWTIVVELRKKQPAWEGQWQSHTTDLWLIIFRRQYRRYDWLYKTNSS